MVSGINRVLSGGLNSTSKVGQKQAVPNDTPIYILLDNSQGFNSKDAHFPDMRFSPLSLQTNNQYNTPPEEKSFYSSIGDSVFNHYPNDYSLSDTINKPDDQKLPTNTWSYDDEGSVIQAHQQQEDSVYDDAQSENHNNLGVFGEAIF